MPTMSLQAIQEPYLSTLSPSFFSYPDSSLPNAPPTLLDHQSTNIYSPMPYNDINWPALEEVSDGASSIFTDFSPMGSSQHSDHYEPSFAKGSDYSNVNLEKITEFEKWDCLPPLQIDPREVPTGR